MNKTFSLEIVDDKTWEKNLLSFPNPHFLQTSLWGEIKKNNGWAPSYLVWKDDTGKKIAGVMVLERKIQFLRKIALKILYCPKGPLCDWDDKELCQDIFEDLEIYAKKRQAIFIKIDPDLFINEQTGFNYPIYGLPNLSEFPKFLNNRGWVPSKEQIQFRNSLYLFLDKTEDHLLSSMKQKTRYNIRLSDRKGVKVRIGNLDDFNELYKLYAETAIRDNFVIRSKTYYMNVWKQFYTNEMCEPFIAEYDGKILAAIIVYYFGEKAYYVYGMSSDKHRNLMATYLLQWKAILRAKEKNKRIYDFWGAPETLNESDRMWGVYKFKLGFGGETVKTIGAWDFPINRTGYGFYHLVLPKILSIMRKIGFKKIKTEIE